MLGSRRLDMYWTFPKLSDDEIAREMPKLLSVESQGLINLYKGITGRVGIGGCGREWLGPFGLAQKILHPPDRFGVTIFFVKR